MNEPQTQVESGVLLRHGIFIVVGILSLFFMWFGMGYFEQYMKPSEFTAGLKIGTLLPDHKLLSPVKLIDQDGKLFTLDRLKGRWTLLVIGYTACPDVCPTMMATFREIDKIFSAGNSKPIVDFMFVSVDPQRDTPEHIGNYVRFFNPRFLGATGDETALRTLTGQMGLSYNRAEGQSSAMGYMIDHSASIVLIDPDVGWKAIFTPPHDPQTIADDVLTVIQNYKK